MKSTLCAVKLLSLIHIYRLFCLTEQIFFLLRNKLPDAFTKPREAATHPGGRNIDVIQLSLIHIWQLSTATFSYSKTACLKTSQ